MHTTPRLRTVASQPAPKTYSEGFIHGHEDGYEQGHRDCGFERLIVGVLAGLLIAAAVALFVK